MFAFIFYFFIHFQEPALSRAVVSSFNQFSKRGECFGRARNPSRTVGNGHSNNNNTKSNLNYALKRLGQNNPQNKHKRGEEGSDQMEGGCGVFIPGGGICVKLCLILGVRVMRVFILGNGNMSEAQGVAIIKAD